MRSCENVTVQLLEENVGKGSAINKSHEGARTADYIISIDGDIINKRGVNWIDMFVEIIEIDSWSLIACDFKEVQIHV